MEACSHQNSFVCWCYEHEFHVHWTVREPMGNTIHLWYGCACSCVCVCMRLFGLLLVLVWWNLRFHEFRMSYVFCSLFDYHSISFYTNWEKVVRLNIFELYCDCIIWLQILLQLRCALRKPKDIRHSRKSFIVKAIFKDPCFPSAYCKLVLWLFIMLLCMLAFL